MAEPTESYPETATNRTRKTETAADGEAALREAIDRHGENLAAALNGTDELSEVLTTAILIVASADDEEVNHLTESTANLLKAADGLSTAELAELAGKLGDDADELSEALDVVLELQRECHLEALVDLAKTLSALDVEADTVEGINDVLAAVSDAHRNSKPLGIIGLLRELRSPEARAGLGYLISLLKAQGRRTQN